MPAPETTACQRLMQADQAYNDLMTGALVRSVTDENGENLQYTATNKAQLLAYIQMLQTQCPQYVAVSLGVQPFRPPMRFLF